MSPTIYLDSSAIVKLVLQESGWQALEMYLRDHPSRSASRIATVEVRRALARVDGLDGVALAARLRLALRGLTIIEFDAQVASAAAELRPATLRSLDAIHLATARELGNDLIAVVTYDARMMVAAANLQIPIASP